MHRLEQLDDNFGSLEVARRLDTATMAEIEGILGRCNDMHAFMLYVRLA